MTIAAAIVGVLLLATVLWDAFETVVLPRRVSRQLRLTRLFYRASWPPFAACAALFKSVNRREAYLSLTGRSLVMLLPSGRGPSPRSPSCTTGRLGGGAVEGRSGLLLDFYMRAARSSRSASATWPVARRARA